MNQKLVEEICRHILSNLGVITSDFIDQKQTKSIIDNKLFILPETLTFETVDGKTFTNHIYGCQISVSDSKEFKILFADCSQEEDVPEYCLITQLKDSPTFGIYLIDNLSCSAFVDLNTEALIAVNVDEKHWMPCSTYLQATFLAGMEQLKDLGFGWSQCSSYQNLYDQLLSFVKFHNSLFGETDEG